MSSSSSLVQVIKWSGLREMVLGILTTISYSYADGEKGLSVDNISFTHFPFWIQIWGLPFESMTEEVGKELGNKLGKYIESDR